MPPHHPPTPPPHLSKREEEVLQLIVEARSPKQIAFRLGLSPHTVATYKATLYLKLGVHSTAELMLWGFRKRVRRQTVAGRQEEERVA